MGTSSVAHGIRFRGNHLATATEPVATTIHQSAQPAPHPAQRHQLQSDLRMLPVRCPLCGGPDGDVWREARDRTGRSDLRLTFVRCRECGLTYQSPVVIPEDAWVFGPPRDDQPTARETTHRCRFVTERFPQPGRMLEVGPIDDAFATAMRALGWTVARAGEAARWTGMVTASHPGWLPEEMWFDQPDPAEPFDLIVLWDSLPRLRNPRAIMRQARRWLAPNGRLIALSPNPDSAVATWMVHAWPHFGLPHYHALWNPKTLTALYESAGMLVDEIAFSGSLLTEGWGPIAVRPGLDSVAERDDSRLGQRFRRWLRSWPALQPSWLARARREGRGGVVVAVGGPG